MTPKAPRHDWGWRRFGAILREAFFENATNEELFASMNRNGAQVVGAQVVGAQVVGAQVVGAQVVGAQVVGAQVVSNP